jgi:hypothetical protein
VYREPWYWDPSSKVGKIKFASLHHACAHHLLMRL